MLILIITSVAYAFPFFHVHYCVRGRNIQWQHGCVEAPFALVTRQHPSPHAIDPVSFIFF